MSIEEQIKKLVTEQMAKHSVPPSSVVDLGFQIVVCDRGFVYCGDVIRDDSECIITNARNIRKWGTTNGLGQLALEGPQSNTVMDTVGTVRVPVRAVISYLSVEETKWKKS